MAFRAALSSSLTIKTQIIADHIVRQPKSTPHISAGIFCRLPDIRLDFQFIEWLYVLVSVDRFGSDFARFAGSGGNQPHRQDKFRTSKEVILDMSLEAMVHRLNVVKFNRQILMTQEPELKRKLQMLLDEEMEREQVRLSGRQDGMRHG